MVLSDAAMPLNLLTNAMNEVGADARWSAATNGCVGGGLAATGREGPPWSVAAQLIQAISTFTVPPPTGRRFIDLRLQPAAHDGEYDGKPHALNRLAETTVGRGAECGRVPGSGFHRCHGPQHSMAGGAKIYWDPAL
jgi:hypothetical protein